LLKLNVTPEVSNLDFSNALTISGFKIPALSTRRVSTTIDVKRDESLIISGMFNDNRSEVRTGIPFLMDVPILGRLFRSTQWQNNQTELLVIVTPVVQRHAQVAARYGAAGATRDRAAARGAAGTQGFFAPVVGGDIVRP